MFLALPFSLFYQLFPFVPCDPWPPGHGGRILFPGSDKADANVSTEWHYEPVQVHLVIKGVTKKSPMSVCGCVCTYSDGERPSRTPMDGQSPSLYEGEMPKPQDKE